MLYKSLKFLEVPTNSFKSHSFRIGGATYLYLKGVSEIQIKHMGRWSSSAFKSYIDHVNSIFSFMLLNHA